MAKACTVYRYDVKGAGRLPQDGCEPEIDLGLNRISKEDSLMMGMMGTTLNGMGGMMQGGAGMFQEMVATMGIVMGVSVLLLIGLVVLVVLAIVWLARDLRSRSHGPGGDASASTRS